MLHKLTKQVSGFATHRRWPRWVIPTEVAQFECPALPESDMS
jgi:hypothetical protein